MTECQRHIDPALKEWRNSLGLARRLAHDATPEERNSVEADVCLTSRSADFAFYTWVVLHGVIDEPAAAELDALFLDALNVVPDGAFRASIAARYGEFNEHCAHVRAGQREAAPLSDN